MVSAGVAALIFDAAPRVDGTGLVGVATVIDGDTLELKGQRMRLFGIDAPEAGQWCQRDGARYACGQQSAFALADLIGPAPVRCVARDEDRYGRQIAVCFSGARDLGSAMVEAGQAVAYHRYSPRYLPRQITARIAQRGLWAGRFEMPWNYRQRNS